MSINTFRKRENESPFFVYEREIYGCYDLAVNIKELHNKNVQNIKLEASVVEKGTGVEQNTSNTIKYHNFRLKLKINGATEEFRPLLPYFGRAEAKTPNGKPVSDITLSLCAHIFGRSRTVEVRSACKNYTTDKDGFAHFALPAVSNQTSKIQLKIRIRGVEFVRRGHTTTKISHKSEEPSKSTRASVDIRTYFPETWLWELQAIGEDGQTIFKRHLPHTITEWIGNAVCMDRNRGLGVSNITSVVGFQPFFLSFTIPYSIIRGEVAQLAVTIFQLLIRMYTFVWKGKPWAKAVERIRTWSEGILFPMLTVQAQSIDNNDLCENKITTSLKAADAITRHLLVEAEGFPKEETKTTYACLKEPQSQQYMENFELKPPSNVVHESARAYVSVSGDLMGPALNGLESLVRLPVGCGEQNMILFAPNIFVLNYITATNLVTEDLKTKTLNFMQIGYQRELKYRHQDGSYSAFGERDKEGSLWLTAFVAKSFYQAKKFITIDDTDLEKTYNWIVKQRREDGCFHSVGNVIHQAMKGGVEGSDQALTAYVLTSLLEYGYSMNDPVILSGFSCIRNIESYPTYLLALMAYAVSLANLPQNEYLEQLEERAEIRGHMKFWKTDKDSKPNSMDIEIASYALLALMTSKKQDTVENAKPIVLWLTTQINSKGGFMSTQDTVVGLHALSLYSMFVESEPTNIQLKVENTEMKMNFLVNNDNRLVSQNMAVKKIPTVLKVTAKGQGCVLIQNSSFEETNVGTETP
ncbi:alpha-2-macroglobulin-like protein 1 [Limulus polyphemus]|uniref:Alpha-2-macroglobulin-like protein 1 n=1 Tax=Limulus polyphemus TaxID=6850 RepID=A0ABM1T9U7_LIMPO|nr:alpha-2-macroglobulin-like protein 1 [Limulus polyphemus]